MMITIRFLRRPLSGLPCSVSTHRYSTVWLLKRGVGLREPLTVKKSLFAYRIWKLNIRKLKIRSWRGLLGRKKGGLNLPHNLVLCTAFWFVLFFVVTSAKTKFPKKESLIAKPLLKFFESTEMRSVCSTIVCLHRCLAITMSSPFF